MNLATATPNLDMESLEDFTTAVTCALTIIDEDAGKNVVQQTRETLEQASLPLSVTPDGLGHQKDSLSPTSRRTIEMTKLSWDKAKWIFEVDGSLRDILVRQTSLADWGKVIDLLNTKHSTNIDKGHAFAYLNDFSRKLERTSTKFDLNRIRVHCHFFNPDEIEFDIDPREVKTSDDFQDIITFMELLSTTLGKQVTLTAESTSDLPFVIVDCKTGLHRVFTEEEAYARWNKPK